MLLHLQIRNLVVVEELSLEFGPGMTVLTGETGAGKSILVDALTLALGAPGERSLVRPGCDRAEVDAVFDVSGLPAARAWLEEQALAAEEDECILRRVLVRQGRSRAFVNGRPVALRQLAELGALLVEIHGQHEHQRLLRPAVQRDLLDTWAGHEKLLETVRRHFTRWQGCRRELEELRTRASERARKIDFLRFQVEELAPLVDQVAELEALEQEQKRLAGAGRLLQESAGLLQLLDEGEPAAQPLLARASVEAERLAGELAPELAPAAELLDSARIQVEEATAQVRDFASRIEEDPARLAEVDRRLGEIHDAARKHRVEPGELAGLFESLSAELELLENADRNLATLEQEEEQARQEFRTACARLTRSRRRAARKLEEELTGRMQELAMEGGRFEVAVLPLEEGSASPLGLDRVEFRVSTNPGQEPAPLSRVASGGELSRLSLAIRVAALDPAEGTTLVFDEVDTGIGGAVAETVGGLLHELAAGRQVFCVTHLAQVAAPADHHFLVSKHRTRGSVRTEIGRLEGEERVREIARMSGGSRITPRALDHAREMVEHLHSRGRLGQSGSRHSP